MNNNIIMKASRAPGPVQSSYVQIHRQRLPRGAQNEKKPKKVAENSSAGEGGVLKKFMNLDDIPDFPDGDTDVWNSLSNNKPSIPSGGRSKTNYGYEEQNDYENDEIDEDDYYESNKPSTHNRNYEEDEEDDNEWNNHHHTPAGRNNNGGYSAATKQVQFQTSAPRQHSANRRRDHQASRDSSDEDMKDEIPEDLDYPYPDQYQTSSSPQKPSKGGGASSPKKKAPPVPRSGTNNANTNNRNIYNGQSVPPPQLPCELSQASEKPLTEGEKLFFSKKPRAVEYKPYTLDQYKLIKPKEYVEIGKMKPDLNTDELVAKRKNAERIKEFSKQLRAINKDSIIAQPKLPSSNEQCDLQIAKQKQESKRNRALEFAKNIPKPKVTTAEEDYHNTKRSQSAGEQGMGGLLFDDESREAARLEELLNKHNQGKAKMDAIKKTLLR